MSIPSLQYFAHNIMLLDDIGRVLIFRFNIVMSDYTEIAAPILANAKIECS